MFNMDEQEFIDAVIEEVATDRSSDKNYGGPSSRSRKRKKKIRSKISTDVWTNANVIKLISEVEIRPCLWNAAHKEHKLRNKRDAAWGEIGAVFGNSIPVERIAAKWQVLRTQCRTNVTNSKKTKSGQGVTKKVHWKYHEQMAFVGAAEALQTTQTESNLSIRVSFLLISGVTKFDK